MKTQLRTAERCAGFALLRLLLPLLCVVAMSVPVSAYERDEALERKPPSAVSAPEIPDPLTLAWCLERAREASPRLQEAAASAAAAGHRVGSAGSLEDPRFSYQASNLPIGDFNFSTTPLSGHQFGLRQKLPFPGLLSSRREAAGRAAEASFLLVDDQRLVTDGVVESAWAEFAFAHQALGITERNILLLRQLAATAESRYRVGSGLQQDVLRAQVELTALLEDRLRRQEAIARTEATLVALLDLPADTALPNTASLASSTENPALAPLIAALDDRSPRLAAARKAVEAARSRVRTAELEGLPDIDVGVGYRLRQPVAGDPVEGQDFFSAGLTIRLPVNRSKWRARVAERKALQRRAEAALRGARAELVSLARRAHAELIRAASAESLLRTGLVPQAQQSLEASRSAYEVGRIEFLSLLDSQVRLLGAELRLARARADKRRAFASLEVATGEKLR